MADKVSLSKDRNLGNYAEWNFKNHVYIITGDNDTLHLRGGGEYRGGMIASLGSPVSSFAAATSGPLSASH